MSSRSFCPDGARPVWATIVTAPRGILLDDTDHIRRNARLIGRNAARSSAMPPGNVTGGRGAVNRSFPVQIGWRVDLDQRSFCNAMAH